MNVELWWQVIHKDQQESFYQGMTPGQSGAEAGRMLEELIEGTDTRSDWYHDGGLYLPLGVWERQGYDITRIENLSKPEDKRVDPVLGDTYRVRILSKGNSGVRATARVSRGMKRVAPISAISDAASAANQLALEDAAKLALEVATAEATKAAASSNGSSTDSSSDDSSSSSDHKKKKKHSKKHSKKHKKKHDKKNSNKEKKLKKASFGNIYIWGDDYALHVM
jgi:hypothetical protein